MRKVIVFFWFLIFAGSIFGLTLSLLGGSAIGFAQKTIKEYRDIESQNIAEEGPWGRWSGKAFVSIRKYDDNYQWLRVICFINSLALLIYCVKAYPKLKLQAKEVGPSALEGEVKGFDAP